MPGQTPIYALRYPQKSDARVSPADIQNLATDVESTIALRGSHDWSLYKALREAKRAALGTTSQYLVSWPWNPAIIDPAYGGVPLVTSRLVLVPQIVPAGEAIDGVCWIQQQAGAYTAVNTNGIAAYTFDGVTFTRIANATNANIWKTAIGYTVQAFSTGQINAITTDRLIWAAALWNQSAVPTIPQIAGNQLTGGVANPNAKTLGLGFYAFQIDFPSQTGMPATIAASASDLTFTNRYWLAFYRNYS